MKQGLLDKFLDKWKHAALEIWVALLQVFLVLLLLLSIFFYSSNTVFVVFWLALVGLYAWVLFWGIRREVKEDFLGYAVFFLFFLMVIVVAQATFFWTANPTLLFRVFLGLVFGMLVFLVFFNFFFGKNWSAAVIRVMGEKEAAVETRFDLLAGIKKGIHVLPCRKRLAKGCRVKVKVEKNFLKGKPVTVLEALEKEKP
jgi:uncharacterized membrane protein